MASTMVFHARTIYVGASKDSDKAARNPQRQQLDLTRLRIRIWIAAPVGDAKRKPGAGPGFLDRHDRLFAI
jgi:hypothetical protein